MINKIRNILSKENGSVVIIVALAMIAFIGIMAVVIDFSRVYVAEANYQKAFDAAAYAGAGELPYDKVEARNVTEEYLVSNSVDLNDVTITISENGRELKITGSQNVEYMFAKVLGITSGDFETSAKIIIGSTSSAFKGLRPFAVTRATLDDVILDEDKMITLKEGAGDGENGRYGYVDFPGGGDGTTGLIEDVTDGYNEAVSIGQILDSEAGNKASVTHAIKGLYQDNNETYLEHSVGSDRVWVLPLVDPVGDDYEVYGFAVFFIEGASNAGGHATIEGRFIEELVAGSPNPYVENTGALSAKLVE